ncbi:hypothetical protein ANS017_32380 [Paraclostridium bifermentans]|uniref:hypothetical protein n=1 Tax=Paraclostridium bifermentans TaxID=1490 RepID=UPI00280FAC2F|nr:hypothetical protein [Paraclostridium bifermentans]GKZ02165.1 hypothetical protein ANS014_05990 [Paraclostridium bifermentans]GKZ07746.1 hypothetical protein ANS015_26290 [Paraclostridium bifermentans]GKZ11854.1 hypothetical protein ANS017_32380 [Paraclostridium bifermentans]
MKSSIDFSNPYSFKKFLISISRFSVLILVFNIIFKVDLISFICFSILGLSTLLRAIIDFKSNGHINFGYFVLIFSYFIFAKFYFLTAF